MQVTFDFLNHRHARTVPLSSAGVAPLPPVFHKLLSVTVTTFNVLFFPPGCTSQQQLHVVCAI